MINLRTILLIIALILFILAALNIPARVNLLAIGLAFWVLALLVAA
jgi:hypothetical protein